MRFEAVAREQNVFPNSSSFDFSPELPAVRLLTLEDKPAFHGPHERKWTAYWDTGAIVTAIPFFFIQETGLPPSGKTKPLKTVDATLGKRPYEFYYVQLGLPGLPLFTLRAIAPDDSTLQHKDRLHHIILGRDFLPRIFVKWSSNFPWNQVALPSKEHVWSWRYRRAIGRRIGWSR